MYIYNIYIYIYNHIICIRLYKAQTPIKTLADSQPLSSVCLLISTKKTASLNLLLITKWKRLNQVSALIRFGHVFLVQTFPYSSMYDQLVYVFEVSSIFLYTFIRKKFRQKLRNKKPPFCQVAMMPQTCGEMASGRLTAETMGKPVPSPTKTT